MNKETFANTVKDLQERVKNLEIFVTTEQPVATNSTTMNKETFAYENIEKALPFMQFLTQGGIEYTAKSTNGQWEVSVDIPYKEAALKIAEQVKNIEIRLTAEELITVLPKLTGGRTVTVAQSADGDYIISFPPSFVPKEDLEIYEVVLSRCMVQRATVRLGARNAEEAQSKALAMQDEFTWENDHTTEVTAETCTKSN